MSESENRNSLVIVLHEIYGVNDHIQMVCRKLASQGYSVLHPDLLGGKLYPYDLEEEAYFNFTTHIGFMKAAEQVTNLIKQYSGEYRRIILLGFSIGATIAWLCSEHLRSCDGVIGCYGSRIRDYMEIEPNCPVVLIFPEEEKSFDPNELRKKLMEKQEVQAYIFEGTHGFADPFSSKYHEKSSRNADRIIEEFLISQERRINDETIT